MRKALLSLVVTVLSISAGPCLAGPAPLVVLVPDDVSTVQAAIDLVATGGEVIVAPGTYNEALDTQGKALTLRSTVPEDLFVAASTIIDATGLNGSVLTCGSGEGPDTVIDGLTLRGGLGTPVLVQPKFGTVVRRGGGLYINGASPTVRNSIVRDNIAVETPGFPPQPGEGGGIFVGDGSPFISTCVIFANTAGHGGGLFSLSSSPTVANSAFVANDSQAIETLLGSIEITSCTFNDNAGAIAFNGTSLSYTMTNNILWGNGTEIVTLVGGLDLTVTFCTVAGGWPGAGNLDADPMFVDAAGFDFRLRPGSPCIDAADNAAVPAGTTADLRGDPRFVDDPDTVDTGLGDPPIVDMGAYEYQPVGTDCPADITGPAGSPDGNVDALDFLLLISQWGGATPCTFAADVTYSAGDGPSSVAVGDLDGDLDHDLAVANQSTDDVSILLNNGDGTFAADVTYGAGDRPRSVAIGDLDGDLDLDLAVANHSNDVSIFFNNGDGTFANDVTYGAGNVPRSVAVGDLDEDLDLDLAVANAGSDDVSILLNNGDGTFAADAIYGAGDAPWSVAIGDLNGDLDPDLAVANQLTDDISILLNNGDGTFADDVTYGAGDAPASVAVGDLDGDLDTDLAVANQLTNDISVLLNNGDGTFADDVTYGAGDAPLSIAVGDLDEDLDLDLAVANAFTDDVSILLNNGDGSFADDVTYDVGWLPLSVAVGDLDGDPDLDLVSTNGISDDVSVLLNDCAPLREGDITGPAGVPDGNVDSLDFLLLIAQWGSPGNCSR